MSEEIVQDLKPSKLPEEPDGPGVQLRKARELRRFSLRDVAVQLHLKLDIIEAIENDNFASLPGSTFVRGYLRGYARLVGLSEDEIIRSFNNLVGTKDSFVIAQSSRRSSSHEKAIKRNTMVSWLPYLLIFGSLGVLMGLYGDASIAWLRTVGAPLVGVLPAAPSTDESLSVPTPTANAQDVVIPSTPKIEVSESAAPAPQGGFYKGLEVVPEEAPPAETQAVEE